jgi:hypothetical protein
VLPLLVISEGLRSVVVSCLAWSRTSDTETERAELRCASAKPITVDVRDTTTPLHHWQDRYHPLKLTLYVALLWAVWHVPDHFAGEGWGVEALISAPVVFIIGFVSLFFARAVFVWFYNVTAFSVLLVAIFHASFDAAISQLSYEVVPGSNTARFLIFTGVIVVFATAVIIATKGQLGRAKEAVETQAGVSDLEI